MAVGVQPTWNVLNANATAIVLQARAALEAITNYNAYLQTIGTNNLVAIATAAGDSTAAADVAEMLAIFGNLASVAGVCNGDEYDGPGLPFNFVAQTIPLWNAS